MLSRSDQFSDSAFLRTDESNGFGLYRDSPAKHASTFHRSGYNVARLACHFPTFF